MPGFIQNYAYAITGYAQGHSLTFSFTLLFLSPNKQTTTEHDLSKYPHFCYFHLHFHPPDQNPPATNASSSFPSPTPRTPQDGFSVEYPCSGRRLCSTIGEHGLQRRDTPLRYSQCKIFRYPSLGSSGKVCCRSFPNRRP